MRTYNVYERVSAKGERPRRYRLVREGISQKAARALGETATRVLVPIMDEGWIVWPALARGESIVVQDEP